MSIVEYTGPTCPREIRKYLMRRTKDEIVSEYLRLWRHCGHLKSEDDDLAANAQWMADIIKTHLAHLPEAREALDASPGASLARRDLIKQAAVLEDVCRDRDTLSTEELRFRAEELHHQAQQKDPS